jgi:signal transduction histidine kinase
MATVLVVGVREPETSELVDALQRAGHETLTAADAPAAIAASHLKAPDFVVLAAGTSPDEVANLVGRLPDPTQRLKEHEHDVDFAMSVARVGVSYRDIESDDIHLSPSLARLLELPPGQAVVSRQELLARVHSEDVEKVRLAVNDAVQRRSEFEVEYRIRNSNGWRWIRSNGRVSPSRDGRGARLYSGLADVTERRTLELQLQQIQKMEAIGQLAGGVAHDFNNLLTAIGGYASLLVEATEDPNAREDLDEIIKAAKRAAALTKQLLAFSRRQVMEPTVVDLNGLIEDMAAMLRRIIGENLQLTTCLADDLPPVRADRNQLEQVVMNLVVNARDATGSRGVIRVETAQLELRESIIGHKFAVRPGKYVRFSVSDTGQGMNEATKARLFEPFFTTKPRGQGTGLGLATVYGIVVQSGGSIDVTSEPGKGSTFTVYLPQHDRPVSKPRALDVGPAPGGSETILIAEDEGPVRALARLILERAGYTVVEAATPAEAEMRSKSMATIDLLLTDVVMPGGTGPELFKSLVARRPSLRVLFMSGYAEQDLFDRASVTPTGVFLPKPFSKQELMVRVREALDKT